jgi:hypothetical protein
LSDAWHGVYPLRFGVGVVGVHRDRDRRCRKNPKILVVQVVRAGCCCVAVSCCLVRLAATSIAPWPARFPSPGTWIRAEMLMDRVYLYMTTGWVGEIVHWDVIQTGDVVSRWFRGCKQGSEGKTPMRRCEGGRCVNGGPGMVVRGFF